MTDDKTDTGGVLEAADPPELDTDDDRPAGGLLRDRRFLAAVAVATVAFIAAVVFGVLWWSTTSTGEYEVSSGRNAALEAAREGVLAFTAIDHTKPDDFRNAQRSVSTDDLNDTMEKGWKKARQQIVANQLTVKVDVEDVGVSKLDTRKGDAQVLAAIKITRTSKGEQKQSALLRMITTLKRVGEDWKVADIAEAPQLGSA